MHSSCLFYGNKRQHPYNLSYAIGLTSFRYCNGVELGWACHNQKGLNVVFRHIIDRKIYIINHMKNIYHKPYYQLTFYLRPNKINCVFPVRIAEKIILREYFLMNLFLLLFNENYMKLTTFLTKMSILIANSVMKNLIGKLPV